MSKNLRERLGAVDAFNAAFVASVEDDARLVREDIVGSMAHARMLARQRLISHGERDAILRKLQGFLKRGLKLDAAYEDVHMNVEHALGKAGAKLHTARSRNDQVALDLRLWTVRELTNLTALLEELRTALHELAGKHVLTVMPGITHLQHAQPVVFAHVLLGWRDAISRDLGRVSDAMKRTAVSPLGAGALAGTTLPIDPAATARELGMAPFTNSIDAVSDRDFAVEAVAACSLIVTHLSQMAEMLVLWSAPEFGFVELPDDLCTSSSLMPQKKNPDMIELVRGKAGRVHGALVNLLTTLKGLPSGYNRDLQETKPPLFDAIETTKGCLQAMARAFGRLDVRVARMREQASDPSMLATDLAEYLVAKGVAFRDAHGVVGRVVRHCVESNRSLAELSGPELRAFHPAFDPGVRRILTVDASVARRSSPGGTGVGQVRKRLAGRKEKANG